MDTFSKNENPERRAVIEEFNKITGTLRNADEQVQVAVGHGINTASNFFLNRFSNMESFKKLSYDEQIQYLKNFNNMENEIGKKEPQTALGFHLFKKWLTALVQSDPELIEIFGNELAHFSKKGEILKEQTFQSDSDDKKECE